MKPRTLILRTAGINCDRETAHAFELAGAAVDFVHINRILQNKNLLDDFQMLAIPGGFSYGDDISSGRILANQILNHLSDAMRQFIAAGKPIIGICNGFQVLVKTGLLPGDLGDRTGQNCTLAHNTNGRFVDRWVRLSPRSDKCIWTKGLADLELPVAHGEGRFVPADEAVRRALWDDDRVALVYVRSDRSSPQGEMPWNPNGSVDDIAGVCDQTGVVFGLMPHPERYVSPFQHPAWTSQRPRPDEGAGLRLFRNALEHVESAVGAGI